MRSITTQSNWIESMLKWALIFLLISLVAGLFGFGGISAAAAGVAKLLFFIAITVFVIFLALAIAAGRAISGPPI